jgi:hypothetical protein
VVGERRADFHCLETFLASPPFAGKTGEDLVLALYDYLTSTLEGTYHFWPPGETEGNPRLRRAVADPVKLLNVYGYAICGQTAQSMCAIYQAAGLPARVFGAPGHVLCEVYYDDRWHVLDVDMWTWFRTPEGHLAGAGELAERPRELILENTNRSDPCSLPDRPLKSYAEMYEKLETRDGEPVNIWPQWSVAAHTMDFRLRPGETLVRSQEHHGRFHMPQSWKESITRHKGEWHEHPRERYEPFRSFGNGRWTYQPTLSADAADFAAGLWEPSDLRQTAAGLEGPGAAVFRMQSPYPFCGVPDWSGEKITSADGVWLSLAGEGDVRTLVTDAEGKWNEVFCGDGEFDRTEDITPLLTARYGCLLKVELRDGSRLRALRFDGYVMTAPMSLPRLAEGDNRMELRCGDKHGLCTTPWKHAVDFRGDADTAAQFESCENAGVEQYVEGWNQLCPGPDGPARLILRLDAPHGRPLAWAYVHLGVREGPADEARRHASLEWSADGKDWALFFEGEVSNSRQKWDAAVNGEATFPNPLDELWLRITSETPVTAVETVGHILEPDTVDAALEVVHSWTEGAGRRTFRAPRGETEYVICCGPDPSGHTIEMSVPSQPA